MIAATPATTRRPRAPRAASSAGRSSSHRAASGAPGSRGQAAQDAPARGAPRAASVAAGAGALEHTLAQLGDGGVRRRRRTGARRRAPRRARRRRRTDRSARRPAGCAAARATCSAACRRAGSAPCPTRRRVRRCRPCAVAAARVDADERQPEVGTRTRPSSPTSTFDGLKSRCTSPASCAAGEPAPGEHEADRRTRGRARRLVEPLRAACARRRAPWPRRPARAPPSAARPRRTR